MSLTAVEYLYELWDAGWDDSRLGDEIRCHPITKKTGKRIYFTRIVGRSRFPGFVDRQKIEAAGEIFHNHMHLYLVPPEITGRAKPPSLPELKAAMAAAHPDRGGTDEEFIAARGRYERAR